MNQFGILVALSLLGAACAAEVISPCVDGGKPEYIEASALVNGVKCTVAPCPFPRGTTATALITFTTNKTVTEISKGVEATVVGTNVNTPFPLPNPNKGCDNLQDGAYCPLDKGERATLGIDMPVLDIYPKVELLLKFFITNQDGEQLGCMKVSAVVTDAQV